MISIEESNQIVSQLSALDKTEQVELTNGIGRILAQPIIADTDQPPFDKSAMDGYTCKREDLGNPLKVLATIAAGTLVNTPIQSGECYRIFTGAPVPNGVDCVIMQEDTSVDELGRVIFTASQTKNNICYKGEDSKKDSIAIYTGTRLCPQHLAIMAGCGVTKPWVYKKVEVSLFCSGSELVEPNVKPSEAMIRNSNASQILGQLIKTGTNTDYKGIVSDNFELVLQNIQLSIGKSDIIIITGGASVGDFDFIPEILNKLGANIIISALNIQPGKPVLYATFGNTHILGLSGNPVSSFLQYKLVAEPIILKLTGANSFLPKTMQIQLSSALSRKKGNRQLYVPVCINKQGQAEPLPFNGSAHIGALNLADGFAILEPGNNSVNALEQVQVILI